MLGKLHWGLLGTARINRAVIPGLKISDRNQIVGVASRSKEKAEDYAKKWDIPRTYSSYEEMLADPDIHVVYNPLPNHLHADWTIRACRAGKHVLCEKPIALSVQEVDAIRHAAKENRVVVMEAFMYRFSKQTEKVQEIIRSGALGDILMMRGTFTFPLTNPEDYRWKPEEGGGGLWDVGCYPVSYSRMVMGEPPVEVFGYQTTSESGVDTVFTGELRFAAGALSQISSSMALPYHTGFQIRGSKASLFIPRPFNASQDTKITLKTGDQEEFFPFSPQDAYLGEIENLADAVYFDQPTRVPLEESRENIATLVALLQSAKEGKPIRL